MTVNIKLKGGTVMVIENVVRMRDCDQWYKFWTSDFPSDEQVQKSWEVYRSGLTTSENSERVADIYAQNFRENSPARTVATSEIVFIECED